LTFQLVLFLTKRFPKNGEEEKEDGVGRTET